MTDNTYTRGNHYADGPANLDHIRTMHDPGAHDFIREGFDELFAALTDDAANPDAITALVTTARILRDEALNVRQVVATTTVISQTAVNPGPAVQLGYRRRERIRALVANYGNTVVFYGSSQVGASVGFPIQPNSQIEIRNMDDVWVWVASGSTSVAIMDEIRSESDGA